MPHPMCGFEGDESRPLIDGASSFVNLGHRWLWLEPFFLPDSVCICVLEQHTALLLGHPSV